MLAMQIFNTSQKACTKRYWRKGQNNAQNEAK